MRVGDEEVGRQAAVERGVADGDRLEDDGTAHAVGVSVLVSQQEFGDAAADHAATEQTDANGFILVHHAPCIPLCSG
ncbi:hypothetical protein D3C72_2275580 [compost metagenome]